MTKERRKELRIYTQFFKYATMCNAKVYMVHGSNDRYIINLPPNSGISKDEFVQRAREYAKSTT